MSDHDAMPPGQRQALAEQLRSNALFVRIMTDLRADCVATWQKSASIGQREELWHRLQAIAGIEDHIERAIGDGKMAQARARRKE